MSMIMTRDATGADWGAASLSELDEQTWLETTLDASAMAAKPVIDQRPVKPAYIFTGVAVAIAVFGTMMAILALSAGAHMGRRHDVVASRPAQHAAAHESATAAPVALHA